MTSTNKKGFSITDGKGYQLRFANGYVLSVQFGGGNYCDNRNDDIFSRERRALVTSDTAEVAAWDADGKWVRMDGDDVIGYITPEQVTAFASYLAAIPNGKGVDGLAWQDYLPLLGKPEPQYEPEESHDKQAR
jgi:hypothetical protein